MKTIEKIIAACDFSNFSITVLQYAGDLAEQLRAQLAVVHVINKRDIESIESAMSMSQALKNSIYINDYVDAVKKERESWLQDLMENKVSLQVEPEVFLKVGAPLQELVRTAEQIRADLIVMGTRGRTSFDDTMFGSTAVKVFQYSPIPVLSVR